MLFTPAVIGLSANDVLGILSDVPSTRIPLERFEGRGLPLIDALEESGLATSKGEARRLLQSGGIYVNNTRVDGVDRTLTREDCIGGEVVLLRRGPKSQHVLRIG